MEPHLWTYRQRISLEHLGQTLVEKKLKTKYPILYEFLLAVRHTLHIMHNIYQQVFIRSVDYELLNIYQIL